MEILKLSDVPVPEAALRAAQVLSEGGLVLYPTDTIYGIAADAENPNAIQKLRELKGRDAQKPISVIVPDIASIDEYAVMDSAAQKIAERFLPGMLTLVLPAKPTISPEIIADGTIGIRIPNNAFCLELAKEFGRPFTATSANRSGYETAKDVAGILKQFGNAADGIALVIDDGERTSAAPSTVLSCVGGTLIILREGAITREELGLA